MNRLAGATLFCAFMAMCGACRSSPKAAVGVPLDAAVTIAASEARRLGYDLDAMRSDWDSANKSWKEFSSSQSSDYPSEPLRTKLEHESYWAVYFGPREEHRMGGDVWVFISRETGECLGVIRGK
jgi:hypothetical protein